MAEIIIPPSTKISKEFLINCTKEAVKRSRTGRVIIVADGTLRVESEEISPHHITVKMERKKIFIKCNTEQLDGAIATPFKDALIVQLCKK